MKSIPNLISILLFVVASNFTLTATGNDMKPWKSYRAEIPNFIVDYEIPPELKLGYGGARSSIIFSDPEHDNYALSLGDGAFTKDVATFYLGVVGDFRDWDLRVEIFTLKFDPNKFIVRSADDLSGFIRGKLMRQHLLINGQEVAVIDSVKTERMAGIDVVVATSIDTAAVSRLGGKPKNFRPFELYYVRLDDEVTMGIKLCLDSVKELEPKNRANSRAMIEAIVERMKPIKIKKD